MDIDIIQLILIVDNWHFRCNYTYQPILLISFSTKLKKVYTTIFVIDPDVRLSNSWISLVAFVVVFAESYMFFVIFVNQFYDRIQ